VSILFVVGPSLSKLANKRSPTFLPRLLPFFLKRILQRDFASHEQYENVSTKDTIGHVTSKSER